MLRMFIVLPLLIISKPADAWTDRGHEITTLNAVRLLGDLGLERWSAPLEVHGSFLVKFANYPDSHLRTIRPRNHSITSTTKMCPPQIKDALPNGSASFISRFENFWVRPNRRSKQ